MGFWKSLGTGTLKAGKWMLGHEQYLEVVATLAGHPEIAVAITTADATIKAKQKEKENVVAPGP